MHRAVRSPTAGFIGIAFAWAGALAVSDATAGDVPFGYGSMFDNVTSAYNFVSFPLVTRIARLDGQPFAATFIGSNYSRMYAIDGDANLVTIDTTTADESVIGSLGISPQPRVSMAADPSDGSLFAIVGDNNCIVTLLYSVSTVDGSATLVAPLPECVNAVAADPANQLLYFLDVGAGAVNVVDAQGNETTLGPIGIPMNGSARIMIDPMSGGLYMTIFEFPSFSNNLYEIDVATGAASFVLELGGENAIVAPALSPPPGTVIDHIFANGFDPSGLARLARFALR